MIVCCGEALIDMLPRALASGGEAFLPVPGGAIFNTAIALGRLGEEAGFFSAISSDMFGQLLVDHLGASRVDTGFCPRPDNPTTLAFVKLVNGSATYSFYDENTAGRMLEESAIPAFPDRVEALHFGGISLISEPCGSTFEAVVGRLHDSRVISLDPNIRPGFITDSEGYRARLARLIGMSDIVKVSEEDLEWLEPGRSFEEIAHDWIDRGVAVVTLTMGGEGARSVTRALDVTVAAKPVTVVDTVGAGDTFNAGFLASLRRDGLLTKAGLAGIDAEALRAALDLGVRVAAYTVGQAGANPPWADQLQE